MKRISCKILSALVVIGYLNSYSQELPYLDEHFPCFNKVTVDKYITDFNIDTAAFGGNEVCDSKVDFKKLINDISIIESGRFQPSANSLLIGGFVDIHLYYQWSKQQTRGMTRAMNHPTATAYNSGGYFTMQDGWAKQSTLGRVGTLIHEARHTQGHYHVNCKFGPYANIRIAGCDKDFESGGSNSVEMEYYARVATQGLNFHPVYKAMARLMAMARSNFIFNKSPLQKREGLMVQTENSDFWLLDQGRWIHRPAIAGSGKTISGVLKRTSTGATLLDNGSAYAIDLYEKFDPFAPLSDTYSYFKILLNSSNNVLDLEEFDIGVKRYLVLISKNNQSASYSFPQGSWSKPKPIDFQIARSTPALADGKSGYFLISNTGQVYSYDIRYDKFLPIKSMWDPNMIAVANVDKRIYSLTKTNQLYLLNEKQWTEVLVPRGQKPKQITTVPLYNVFNVVE